MADYTDITDGQTNPGSPVTSDLAKALRDNPIAISEGAAGAPSVTPNIAANMVAGEIGSLAFARCTIDVAYGATVAGSTLCPTSGAHAYDGPGNLTGFNFDLGTALTGTWRCLGTSDAAVASSGGPAMRGATLFLRIV